MIAALLTLLGCTLVGLAASRLTGRMNAFIAGAGCTGLIVYLAGVANIRPVVAAGVVILAAIVILAVVRHGDQLRLRPLPATVAAAVFVVLAVLLSTIAVIVPNHDYDGRAFWLLKAKAISHEQSIQGRFFHGATVNPRNQYPLLLPIDASLLMTAAHDLDDRNVRLFYLFFGIALAYEVSCRFSAWFSPSIGGWMGVLLLLLPQIATENEGGVLSAYSDIALGAFVACAFFELIDGSSPLRFGLFAAFVVLTKSEGLPLSLMLLAAAAVVFRRRSAPAFIPVTVAITTLLVWRAHVPRTDEQDFARSVFHVAAYSGRFFESLAIYLQQCFAMSDWGLSGVAVLLAAAVLAVRSPRSLFLPVLIVVPMIVLYAAVFAVSGWPMSVLAENLAPRTLTHLIGPLLYVLGSAIALLDHSRHGSVAAPGQEAAV